MCIDMTEGAYGKLGIAKDAVRIILVESGMLGNAKSWGMA